MLRGQILWNQIIQNSDSKDPRTMIVVWDTGASYGLTSFRSDFIYDVRFDITFKYVTKVNRVIGIGTTLHKFIKINNQNIYSCRVFPITSSKQMYAFSLPILTIK